MYFFKRHETGSSNRLLAESGATASSLMTLPRFLIDHLAGEEKPGRMLLELCLLVLLLHVWILVHWLRPNETVTPALPLIMQVSLISSPAPKPAVTPQTIKPAPVPKKLKPVIPKKSPKIVRPTISPPTEPAPAPVPAKPDAGSSTAPAPAPAPSPASSSAATAKATAAPKSETFTEANFRANYGFNPKPNYPRIARNRSWQGKVLLRVQVSAEGTSNEVTVHRSSGHEILDDSAVEAVKQWRFIPAKRGDKPVASSVIVPILFKLND